MTTSAVDVASKDIEKDVLRAEMLRLSMEVELAEILRLSIEAGLAVDTCERFVTDTPHDSA